MKQKFSLSILLLSFTFTTYAQKEISDLNKLKAKNSETKNVDTVAWIYNGNFALGLNQGILHNWSAGGELMSLTVNSLFNGNLTRYNNRLVWSNTLDLAYGLFYAYSNDFIPRKTDDRIDFTSKYGYRLKKDQDFYFTGLVNAKTQFTNAYNYDVPGWDSIPTSRFVSPLYLTLAPGFEFRKGSQLSLFLSPAAIRTTFVDQYFTQKNPEGAFGVKYGETFRFELGAYFSGRYETNITENINYRARLDLYSNYLAKDQFQNGILVKKDNPGNIDILIENNLTFKFFKYFSFNIGLTAIYDNDVPYDKTYLDKNGIEVAKQEPFSTLGWWQIKQVSTIGFNYKF